MQDSLKSKNLFSLYFYFFYFKHYFLSKILSIFVSILLMSSFIEYTSLRRFLFKNQFIICKTVQIIIIRPIAWSQSPIFPKSFIASSVAPENAKTFDKSTMLF